MKTYFLHRREQSVFPLERIIGKLYIRNIEVYCKNHKEHTKKSHE